MTTTPDKKKKSFSFKVNKYNDLCLRDIPNDMWRFADLLDEALGEAALRNSPVIWIFLSEKQGDLIPIALRENYKFHSVVSNGVLRMYLQLHGGPDQIPNVIPHTAHVEAVVVHWETGWDEPHFLCQKNPSYKKTRLPSTTPDRHEFLAKSIVRHLQTFNVATEVKGMLGVWENRFGPNNLVSLHFGYLLHLAPEQNSRAIDAEAVEWVPVSKVEEVFKNRYEAEWFNCAPLMVDRTHPRSAFLRNWMAHLALDPDARGLTEGMEARDTREMLGIVPTLEEWEAMSETSREILQKRLDNLKDMDFSTSEVCKEIRNKNKK